MRYRELVLEDFKQIDLGGGLSYLSARRGNFEITLEEHLTAGFTIRIFDCNNKFLALEKKTYYMKNHPAGRIPENVPAKLITRALLIANGLLEKYGESDPATWHTISNPYAHNKNV